MDLEKQNFASQLKMKRSYIISILVGGLVGVALFAYMQIPQTDDSQVDHSQMDHSAMMDPVAEHAARQVIKSENALPYYNSGDFTPFWYATDSAELKDFHRIPKFDFTNQEGLRVDQDSVEDKVYVASFFFSTCPGICPTIQSKLSKVQDKFIDDDGLVILSHSIRPTTDTIEVLASYAAKHGVRSEKWHLLTGEREAIYGLAKDAYFANEDLGNIADLGDFLHTENLLLIDTNGHIRGVYNGLSEGSVDNLIADIDLLKLES